MDKKYFFIGFIIFIIIIGIFAFLFFSKKADFSFSKAKTSDFIAYISKLFSSSEFKNNFIDQKEDSLEVLDEKTKLRQEEIEKGIIKSIYFTSYSASSKSRINYAFDIIDTTKINAVVIDIKDYSGYVFYDSKIPEVEKYGSKKLRIADIESLVKNFHKKGIYVIARVAVFQDPVLANARNDLAITKKSELSGTLPFLGSLNLWLDNLKLAWVDPASEEVWDYNIAVAKEAFEKGFDEVNFDYVRFPSDGNLSNMQFPVWDNKTPKSIVIKNFFEKTRKEMPDKKLSVDLFGLTTTNYDDLGVGQIIEYAYENFDYICPMVYPSHYASGFLGYNNPAQYPYEVVKYSMDMAKARLSAYKLSNESEDKKINAELRPWLQDFNMGAIYDSDMVKSEIQAVYDSLGENNKGYMLWNPSNIYTTEAFNL